MSSYGLWTGSQVSLPEPGPVQPGSDVRGLPPVRPRVALQDGLLAAGRGGGARLA